VWAPTNRLVKVGWCKGNPEERVRTLQCGSAEPLELLSWQSGASQDEERAYHRVFAGCRVRGEWFWPLPALMELAGRRELGEYLPSTSFPPARSPAEEDEYLKQPGARCVLVPVRL
jgi:hypothetical protein